MNEAHFAVAARLKVGEQPARRARELEVVHYSEDTTAVARERDERLAFCRIQHEGLLGKHMAPER